MSAVRQNYSEACESWYQQADQHGTLCELLYQSMAYHFDRDDVAMKGTFNWFKKASDEERDHAQMLMEYQNKRGGRIVLQDVKAPGDSWNGHVHALEDALALERKVNESLLSLHGVASANNDAHLCDFLETNYLDEQVQSINEIAKLIVNAKRCGDGLGAYVFDKETMGGE